MHKINYTYTVYFFNLKFIIFFFSEELICASSKEPDGDWENDILENLQLLSVYLLVICRHTPGKF